LGAQRWQKKLKSYQEAYFETILKREILIKALDSVLNISGLWRGFYAGSLNDFISLGCDEVSGVDTSWNGVNFVTGNCALY
jgi:hypothetical protein